MKSPDEIEKIINRLIAYRELWYTQPRQWWIPHSDVHHLCGWRRQRTQTLSSEGILPISRLITYDGSELMRVDGQELLRLLKAHHYQQNRQTVVTP